jgi:integrase
MIEVHRLCGGRSRDIVEMRPADIDRTGPIWEYRPVRYKTEHYNEESPDRDRTVFLGPRAQKILTPLLPANESDFIFSPRRAEDMRNAHRRSQRKTPLWPSHARLRGIARAHRRRPSLRDRYDAASYRRAIRRACIKAGIPVWHPNQLRHCRLTEIRRQYGLEASKACAGHREIGTTQIYAERDGALARNVMAEIG